MAAFHFLSRRTWLASFAAAGLALTGEFKRSPFMSAFVLQPACPLEGQPNQALRTTLASLGDLPSRNLSELRQRIGNWSEHAVVTPFFTMAMNAPSHGPKTRMNRSAGIAARKSAIP